MALMDRHIEETKTAKVKVVEQSNQDDRILSLKALLSDGEIQKAVSLYEKYTFAFQDKGLRIGSSSHQQLLKQLWISALETRVDLDPMNF